LIRQSVSCDVCGTEKRQTNHWFVALEVSGELRLSALNIRSRSRADAKHLCGQKCLHKLVDDFMERSMTARTQPAAGEQTTKEAPVATDTSLTSNAAYAAHAQDESAARLLAPAPPLVASRPPASVPAASVADAAQVSADLPVAPLADEAPVYVARSWRAEAWERERERERRSDLTVPARK
jgi:hypothetical protein